MSENGFSPGHEHRLKSPGSIQATGVADPTLAQAAQLIESIGLKLSRIRQIDDHRASVLAKECEAILAEIVQNVGLGGAIARGRLMPTGSESEA